MLKNRGLTLIEVIVALALLGIISVAFLSSLSTYFAFIVNTKTITENTFEAQRAIEQEIDEVKEDLRKNITPGAPVTRTLFSGPYQRTVRGYIHQTEINPNRMMTVLIGETRMPEYPVPRVLDARLLIRLNSSDQEGNYEHLVRPGLSLRGTAIISDPDDVFLVNRHEWFVSRPGFNIPMVAPELIDENFDFGRLYPLFPHDFYPVPIKGTTDQLNWSDLNSLLEEYAGRHIIYTITPYADSGKKGATIFADPVFMAGPPVYEGMVLHLDASLINKGDSQSVSTVDSQQYVKLWKDISPRNNHARQNNQNAMPRLYEVQYKDNVYVWGLGLAENSAGTQMTVSPFDPANMGRFSVFLVAKLDDENTGSGNILEGGSNNWRIGWNDDGNLAFRVNSGSAVLSDKAGIDGNWNVFSFAASNNNLRVRLNGQEAAEGSYSGSAATNPFKIFWNNAAIAEVLIYSRDVSENGDLAKIEKFLYNKYNPDPDDIAVHIVFLEALPIITVYKDQPFVMPSTVNALMSNGITQHVAVNWSNQIDTSQTGIQTSIATAVMDSTKTTTLTVHVVAIDYLLPLEPIEVEKGRPYPLPSALPAMLTNGQTANVEVEWNGTVESLGIGVHTLTARAKAVPSKTVDLQVTVKPVTVTGITLEPESARMKAGETRKLSAAIIPADAENQEIIWSTSDSSVVTVDQNGNVTARGKGSAVVTAASAENPDIKAACEVEVYVPVSGVTISGPNNLLINETANLSLVITPPDADYQTIEWTSSRPGVVSVDQNGNIRGISHGDAVIRAIVRTDDGDHTAQHSVSVAPEFRDVSISNGSPVRRQFILRFNKDIDKVDLSPQNASYSINGSTVTFTRSSNFTHNENLDIIVTAVTGERLKVIVQLEETWFFIIPIYNWIVVDRVYNP